MSGDPEHTALATRRVNEFVNQMRARGSSDKLDGRDFWSVALGLSACDKLNGAIEVSDYVLKHLTWLPVEDFTMVRFNLANSLVERAGV